jgi:hypothetical protein
MQNKQEFQEFTEENKRFLEREEKEFLESLQTSEFIKNFLENLTCNSINVFLCLYCVNLGLGIVASAAAGFSIGCFSGCKDIYQSKVLASEGMDFKIVRGGLKIALAAFISWQAVSEWRNILYISEKTGQYFQEDVMRYQKDNKSGLNPQLLFAIYVAGGAAVAILGLGTIKKF